MLSELMEFIETLEWHGRKVCPVLCALDTLFLWFMSSITGYMTGQIICIYFGIGVLGK